MSEKIIVGPIDKGLRNNRIPVAIDNDSFPTLINAYQWRGRVKRKRGTVKLGRLKRLVTIAAPNNTNSLLTGLEANASLVPGSLNVIGSGGQVWTDLLMDGTIQGSVGGVGTVNYATGVITGPTPPNTGTFQYYPDLPVMGLEDFVSPASAYPTNIGFDTVYSYFISPSLPAIIYDVSYYKNIATGTPGYPFYTQKNIATPLTWNGQDYQQFWTTNYQGAMWATNGINIPFNITNIGMQFSTITNVTIVAVGPPAGLAITMTSNNLVVGDFVFLNEIQGIIGANFQTGYVTSSVGNVIGVVLPNATVSGVYTGGGIVQYLTNRSDVTKDGIRWYDGDPTVAGVVTPGVTTGLGWVNFAPPLSQSIYSIADLPEQQYYLVGARMIVPFKDRLLFLGPVIQSSSAGSQKYLQDTIIYSQNGTPYYTASWTNSPNPAIDTPASPTNVFFPILVPTDQTASPAAWFEDQTGFGGFITAGIDQPITTVGPNEDVLIVGFSQTQTRLVYSGNDIVPFNFFLVNSELGSGSTFSSIIMDRGIFTRGSRGYISTAQTGTERIDLDIPDEVFQMNLLNNGAERVSAQRDFINEWLYFSYSSNDDGDPESGVIYKFPTRSLFYNYRDGTWAIFIESYTTYGQIRPSSGLTWATIGNEYSSWATWNDPWNAGQTTILQTQIMAGNQQGFVVVRDIGTNETPTLFIQNIVLNLITSPNHNLNDGDYIIISNVLGTIASQVNGNIFSVFNATTNTFSINPTISGGTYLGGGVITRMYVPSIQTKQFPASWGMARKTRLGPQQYLFSNSDNAQITLLIFLSQNASFPYNLSTIVPATTPTLPINNSLVYSTVLYTCPESTNLGLSPANINLNMVTAVEQDRIWHRKNTSLLGDTIQIGFTLSDAQMRSLTVTGAPVSITGIIQSAFPGDVTTLIVAGPFDPNQLITITDVIGMVELNNNNYNIITSTATQTVINVDSLNFTQYISGGNVSILAPVNQFAEIELHGFILDVSPSMVLA